MMASNLFSDKKYFTQFASYSTKGGTVNVVTLKQADEFAQFVVANSRGTSESYVSGNAKFLFKAFKSMKYIVDRSDTKLSLLGKKQTEPSRFFYIARDKKNDSLLNDAKYTVLQKKTYGKFTILFLEGK